MSRLSTQHRSLVLGRTFDVPCARVFAACADPDERQAVAALCEDLTFVLDAADFRIGGADSFRFGLHNHLRFRGSAVYNDIVPERRIVTTEVIHEGDIRLSVAITTLEFDTTAAGARLKLTTQIVSLDDEEANEDANERYDALLTSLERHLGSSRRRRPRPVILR